jgi:selenide,water dikinase
LRPIEHMFNPAEYPDLLVGLNSPDDAAVWKLDDERALVVTTDFFTPVVDTPYEYGAISAANSLSDVYAMGGTPFLALNIAALPPDLPKEISSEILRGGAEKCREAGVVIAGGHTVQDKEPKYGLVAVGMVHPQKMITKSGAKPGDRLMLTKPLGFGVTTTALKQEKAEPADVEEVIQWMSRLNRDAGRLAVEFELCGGTDVTGFSLLGHCLEMTDASDVKFVVHFDQVPFISCARKFAEMGTFPGGSSDNFAYFAPQIKFDGTITEMEQMLLFDAQTSGGLLLAVPEEKAASFFDSAKAIHQPVWVIGEVTTGDGMEVIR